jgi:hypothetical protein
MNITVRTKPASKSLFQQGSFYVDERTMVQDLSTQVVKCGGSFGFKKITHEFDYSSGRTDLVGLGQKNVLHAFEAKLTKWREALHQARRNTCFAHYCYVALPKRAAGLAMKAKDDFVRHGVGLVVVSEREVKLAIRPRRNAPLLPWLTETALSRFTPGRAISK